MIPYNSNKLNSNITSLILIYDGLQIPGSESSLSSSLYSVSSLSYLVSVVGSKNELIKALIPLQVQDAIYVKPKNEVFPVRDIESKLSISLYIKSLMSYHHYEVESRCSMPITS